MANTYRTMASSGKNDFEKFMEDMNKIGGYDSNRETSSSWTGTTKPVNKPTGSSTTAKAKQGTVTNYGSTPSYDRQDALLDRKERIAVENRNQTWMREDFDKANQRAQANIARGDALAAQRYNRTQNRNAGFEAASQRRLALNAASADKRANAKEARFARRQQNRNNAIVASEARKDRMKAAQQSHRDYFLQREQLKQNNKWKDREFDYRGKELDLTKRKYDAEIAALNTDLRLRENQNQQQWASMALNYANSALDRGLRQQELESRRRDQELDRQARAWSVVGNIFS